MTGTGRKKPWGIGHGKMGDICPIAAIGGRKVARMCEARGVRVGMVAEWDTAEGDELLEAIKRGNVLTTIVGTDGSQEQEAKAKELCGEIGRQGGYWVYCDYSKRKAIQGRRV